jgi:Leucine-rich repeat (LRR) protein
VLDRNNVTVLENDTFVSKGFVDLEILEANFCKIRKTEFRAFNGLTLLTHLSLKGNDISEIIPGTFEMISHLEYLNLRSNKIEHLESDVFRGLIKIQHINLERNKLQYLHPDTFLGLKSLQSLDLSYKFGLHVPTDHHFINSRSLKGLDISTCKIPSVSDKTFANVSALEWLDLR